MQYLIDESTRNALLAYMEERERPNEAGKFGMIPEPNEEMTLAAQLRDLKALRPTSGTISDETLELAKLKHLNTSLSLIENTLFKGPNGGAGKCACAHRWHADGK